MPISKTKIEKLVKDNAYDKAFAELQKMDGISESQKSLINFQLDSLNKYLVELRKSEMAVDMYKKFLEEGFAQLLSVVLGTSEVVIEETKQSILFLSSNPTETGKLQLDTEFVKVYSVCVDNKQFSLAQKFSVTALDFQMEIEKVQPKIVHFAGHGVGKEAVDKARAIGKNVGLPEGIIVQKSDGKPFTIEVSGIKKIFEDFVEDLNPKIELVFLNCCYSWKIAEAIKKSGVPYVIGMKNAIYDETAIAFAESFYKFYALKSDVKYAFKRAMTYLGTIKCPDKDVPTLY